MSGEWLVADVNRLRSVLLHLTTWDLDKAHKLVKGTRDEALVESLCVAMANETHRRGQSDELLAEADETLLEMQESLEELREKLISR